MYYVVNSLSINMLGFKPEHAGKSYIEGLLSISPITEQTFRNIIENEKFVSAIGHKDLANLVGLEANRIEVELRGYDNRLLVVQYTGPRLPEGTTTLPEGANIQYFSVCWADRYQLH